MTQKIDFQTAYGSCLIKAWQDPKYNREFQRDPHKKFEEEGYPISKEMKVYYHVSNQKEIHLTLPRAHGVVPSFEAGAPKARHPEFVKAYQKCVEKAAVDPKYKAELLSNPRKKILAEGYEIPKHFTVKIHESTCSEKHFSRPPKPIGDFSKVSPKAIGYYAWQYR